MNKKLVVFDFDGTLTRSDSMLEFIRFYWGNTRFFLGMLYLLPMLLSYKAGWIPNWRAKEYLLTHFFGGEPYAKFQEVCSRFGQERIPALLRPEALRQLEVHRAEGCQLVVASSSAEEWLSDWCRKQKLPLIATRVEVTEGRLSGKLDGPNCYGMEKVNRLREDFHLEDYAAIVVYGDSKGDFELFKIATEYHYKPFRK